MRQAIDQSPEKRLKKKTSWRRILIEWAAVAGLFLFLTQTGAGLTVRSWLQRGVLWTGLFRPSLELSDQPAVLANYRIPLVDLDGAPVHFDELRGKVIFMNLWASWCSPCLAEMPFIQKLYEATRSDQIAFAMISLDESREIAKSFVELHGYTFPVYFLSGMLPSPYTSTIVPTTYVISPEGTILTVHTGMANYDTDAFRAFLLEQAERAEAEP